jgi:hypothetical protein
MSGKMFFGIAAFFIFLIAVPVFGQSEYSDAYTVDSSDNSYDPDTGNFNMGDNVPPLDLVGVGVSEADYNANVYSTSTTTTITSPSGANTVTNSSSGFTYARSEAFSLQLSPDTVEEGDYTVSSEHTYYEDSCYTPRDQDPMPCGPVASSIPNFSQSPFRYASYKSPSVLNASSSFFPTSYTSYSYFGVGVRTFFNGFQYAAPGYGGCHSPFPFGYRNYCDIRTPCQKATLCAAGVSQGIQVVSLRVTFFGFSACYSKGVYVPTRPRCSPPAY